MKYAIPGYYACGAAVRVDPYTYGEDDVGIFGLKMIFCHRLDRSKLYYVKVRDDNNFVGDWHEGICADKKFIFGVQTQTQSGPSALDDTALHGMKIFCRDPCEDIDAAGFAFEEIGLYES